MSEISHLVVAFLSVQFLFILSPFVWFWFSSSVYIIFLSRPLFSNFDSSLSNLAVQLPASDKYREMQH